MVSQPEPSPSSQVNSHRRKLSAAASAASVPFLSRTRRYGRSHAGGASYVPQNDFPVFSHSGDVEVLVRVVPTEKYYILHRDTLARCSGFFEASTSSEWSKKQTFLPGGNEATCVGEETPPGDIPMLVQKAESSVDAPNRPALPSIFGSGSDARSKPANHTRSSVTRPNHVTFSRSFTTLSLVPILSPAGQDLLRDYDNLFRIFYNYAPILDGVSVADAYVQCKSLLALADQYDALSVVGPRVDHHLLQFQSRLWKQIAKYPVSYLRLGCISRSKVIFREALIHVVGQWPVGERSLRATLPDSVLDIIEDKVDELEEKVSRVEGRLFRLNLVTPRGEPVKPTTSYLDCLAVSLFRQWLADNTALQPLVSRSGPSARAQAPSPVTPVGRAYRTLGGGSLNAFLGHDEYKRFLKLTPELYSRDNLRRFEKRMDELKTMARDIVQPLLGSGLELDLGDSGRTTGGVGYLTCTAVGHRDLPWLVEG